MIARRGRRRLGYEDAALAVDFFVLSNLDVLPCWTGDDCGCLGLERFSAERVGAGEEVGGCV